MRRSCGILLKKPLHQDFEDPVRWWLYENPMTHALRNYSRVSTRFGYGIISFGIIFKE